MGCKRGCSTTACQGSLGNHWNSPPSGTCTTALGTTALVATSHASALPGPDGRGLPLLPGNALASGGLGPVSRWDLHQFPILLQVWTDRSAAIASTSSHPRSLAVCMRSRYVMLCSSPCLHLCRGPWLTNGTGDHLSRHFRSNIRVYNNALSFASLGATVDPISHTPGVPVFKIQGQLFHRLGGLLPPTGQPPRFLQVYFADNTPAGQALWRHQHSSAYGTNPVLLDQLSHMMNEHNPFAQLFLNAADRIRAQGNDAHISLSLTTVQPWSKDPRRYNMPRSREVGAIIPHTGGPTITSHREIRLHSHRSQRLVNIDECNPHYLPLRFVLLLPFGTSGWMPGLTQGVLHGYGQNITEPSSE